jgi:hypothetical protein
VAGSRKAMDAGRKEEVLLKKRLYRGDPEDKLKLDQLVQRRHTLAAREQALIKRNNDRGKELAKKRAEITERVRRA